MYVHLAQSRVRLCSPSTTYIQLPQHLDGQEAALVSGTSPKTTDLPSYDRPLGLPQTDILSGPRYMRSTKLLSFDLIPLPAFIRFSTILCAVKVHISGSSTRTVENHNCVDYILVVHQRLSRAIDPLDVDCPFVGWMETPDPMKQSRPVL